MLNIKDAIELFLLLDEFVPSKAETNFEYVASIISAISKSDKPDTLGRVLLLLYPDETPKSLAEKSSNDIIKMFTLGLDENDFLSLIRFCRYFYGD